MSKPQATTEPNTQRTDSSSLIHIQPELALEIERIAIQRQMKAETLVNEILERYIARQQLIKRQSDAAFLSSIAGMFDSGANNTSENVPLPEREEVWL